LLLINLGLDNVLDDNADVEWRCFIIMNY